MYISGNDDHSKLGEYPSSHVNTPFPDSWSSLSPCQAPGCDCGADPVEPSWSQAEEVGIALGFAEKGKV